MASLQTTQTRKPQAGEARGVGRSRQTCPSLLHLSLMASQAAAQRNQKTLTKRSTRRQAWGLLGVLLDWDSQAAA